MIDSIVYGSDRENFSCDPSSRDQEAELIRGYILLHCSCGYCSCALEIPLAVNRSLLFVHSFIRCEWMAKMNIHGSLSSSPNFTSKSMPIVYPKVIKLNVYSTVFTLSFKLIS